MCVVVCVVKMWICESEFQVNQGYEVYNGHVDQSGGFLLLSTQVLGGLHGAKHRATYIPHAES